MYEWALIVAIATTPAGLSGGMQQQLITGFSSFELCTQAANKIAASAAQNLKDAGSHEEEAATTHCMRIQKRVIQRGD